MAAEDWVKQHFRMDSGTDEVDDFVFITGNPVQNETSTFYVSESLHNITHMTNAVLNIAESGPVPPNLDPEKEELIKDALYSFDCCMGKSGKCKVRKSSSSFGIDGQKGLIPTTTVVTLEEVTQHLQEAFSTDQPTIQRLREEAQQRKLAEFCLKLTVLEADIQCQRDAKSPTNSYVRIKIGPKLLKAYDTPLIKGTRHPKWNHDMELNLSDLYIDYILIELWLEKEEYSRRKKYLTPGFSQVPVKNIRLAHLLLPLKDTLQSGISGWHILESDDGSNLSKIRIHLSGHISCMSDVESKNQEAYDTLLKCFIDHHIKCNSQHTDQRDSTGDSWKDSVPANVTAILSQYATILNLSKGSQLLSWWSVVTNMSSSIDWQLVLQQYDRIKALLVMGSYSDEEQNYIRLSVSKVIDNCIKDVQNLEKCFPVAFREQSKSQLKYMLQTMKSIEDHPYIKSLLNKEHPFNSRTFVKAALQGFSRQWWNGMADLLNQCSTKKEDQLHLVLTITKEVYGLLQKVCGFYEDIFSNECNVCCLKVIYQIIVKEMVEAFEPIIISCCQAIPESVKLTGNSGIECDFLIGSYLMEIYKKNFKVFSLQCPHLTSVAVCETGVEEYHKCFETGIKNQLALTTDREYHLICEKTSKDTLHPISPQTHFSASLLEARAIPHRFKVWWSELAWPDKDDQAACLIQVLHSLVFLTFSYCKTLYEKIDYILEESDGNSQQFINEKVCVVITNMESAMKDMKQFPDVLGYKFLEVQVTDKHNKDVRVMVDTGLQNIRNLLQSFIDTVIDNRKEFLQRNIIKSCQTADPSAFLKKVLHPTIDLLRELLHIGIVKEFLRCLWENLLKIMQNIINNGIERDPSFYGEMLKMLEKTFSDLTPDSDEALDVISAKTEEYTSLIEDLKVKKKSTTSLITLFYQERYKEQIQESVPSSASLVIRTWFKESKLKVHVLMVKDIVVPAEERRNAPLDYYIQIELLPDEFPQETQVTQVLKEDPATFDREFEFDVSKNKVNIQDGVLVLRLKDYNRTRRDTFLGESVFPLAEITSDITNVQYTYLKMTLPSFGEGCSKILQVLHNRKLDHQAAAFIKKLKKRHRGVMI